MGRITEKLRQEFKTALQQRVVSFEALQRGEENAASIKTIEELVEDGHHPVHALFKNMTNLMSLVVEELACMPFMHRAHDFLVKAEDIYQPGYPPMSPITTTHFVHWTLFDVPFGKDKETLGQTFLGAADLLGIEPIQVEAARILCESRLGLYEVIGARNPFRLRELVTGMELDAHIPSGFQGAPGDLILARVLPPPGDLPSPHIGVTTPYVLVGCSKSEWVDYFRRQGILAGAPGVEERLYRHMKYGKDEWYWSEFLFYGYRNYNAGAVFLTGFPDLPKTQPHHPARVP